MERRANAHLLERLETLIAKMEQLGIDGEDAAARVTAAIPTNDANPALVTAIGDVLDIVSERSKLAHEAHRVMSQLRNERHQWSDQ